MTHGQEQQTEACMHENNKTTDEEKSKSQTDNRLRCVLYLLQQKVSIFTGIRPQPHKKLGLCGPKMAV